MKNTWAKSMQNCFFFCLCISNESALHRQQRMRRATAAIATATAAAAGATTRQVKVVRVPAQCLQRPYNTSQNQFQQRGLTWVLGPTTGWEYRAERTRIKLVSDSQKYQKEVTGNNTSRTLRGTRWCERSR